MSKYPLQNTLILPGRTYIFMETSEPFPLDQKGCKTGSHGCKDQLLINRMVTEHCKFNHKFIVA